MRLDFLDIPEEALAGTIVILDIDGTLVHDRGDVLDARCLAKVRALASKADVYLSSNTADRARVKRIAEEAGVRWLDSLHKKPHARALSSLDTVGRRVVVVGDKTLTDGLFARNIGAEFFHVRRMRSHREHPYIRATYFFDELYTLVERLMRVVRPYAEIARPQQWIKNLIVFAPIFFAGSVFAPGSLVLATGAFLAFCLAASATYCMNDIADYERDQAHPKKRARALARGALSVRAASLWGVVLALGACAVVAFIPALAPVLGLYAVLNVLYSRWLKHVAIVDITTVASFYVMRVLAGGAATSTYVSPWIICVVFFGALFLVTGKRRAESLHTSRRAVLDSYAPQTLDVLVGAAATLAVISYSVYTILGAHAHYAVYSTVFVCAAIFRTLNRMYQGDAEAEYPESLALKDPWVLALGGLWILYMGLALYY